VREREEARMTPNLPTRATTRLNLPLDEMKVVDRTGFLRKIRSWALNVLSLSYLLDIYVETSRLAEYTLLVFRRRYWHINGM